MPYIERTIRSGKMIEKEVYFSTRYGSKLPRSANENQTPADMEKINEKRSMKRLQRLILANFSKEDEDLFITYTYGMPVTEQQAMRGERNLLDRIRRLRKRKGLPALKYIVVTEKQSQWHHHIIMNGGLSWEEIRAVWGDRGARIHVSMLDDTQVCEGLARYLTEQHKPKKGTQSEENNKQERRRGQRRWHASRNLAEPEEKREVLKKEPKIKEPKATIRHEKKTYQLMKDSVQMGYDVYGMVWLQAAYIQIADAGRGRKRSDRPRGSGAAAPAGWRAEPSVLKYGKGGVSEWI